MRVNDFVSEIEFVSASRSWRHSEKERECATVSECAHGGARVRERARECGRLHGST